VTSRPSAWPCCRLKNSTLSMFGASTSGAPSFSFAVDIIVVARFSSFAWGLCFTGV